MASHSETTERQSGSRGAGGFIAPPITSRRQILPYPIATRFKAFCECLIRTYALSRESYQRQRSAESLSEAQ